MRFSLPRLALLLALLVLLGPTAEAQETAESPELDKEQKVTVGGMVQTQFNTSPLPGVPDTELVLRRTRLSANAKYNDLVSGRIQAELANAAVGGSAELNEAYVLLTFDPAFQVLVGKGGRPFGVIDATPAAKLLPIERGARIRGLDDTFELYRILEEIAYAGRSVGVQALGEVPLGTNGVKVIYAGGYFRGALGEDVGPDADIRQVAGRVVLQFPGAQVGFAATNRAFGAGTGVDGRDPEGNPLDPTTVGGSERGSALSVDFQVGDPDVPGLIALGEFNYGTFDPFTETDFVGAQFWLGYGLASTGLVKRIEPLARVSYGDFVGGNRRGLNNEDLGTPLDGGLLLTPGINLYFAPGTTANA